MHYHVWPDMGSKDLNRGFHNCKESVLHLLSHLSSPPSPITCCLCYPAASWWWHNDQRLELSSQESLLQDHRQNKVCHSALSFHTLQPYDASSSLHHLTEAEKDKPNFPGRKAHVGSLLPSWLHDCALMQLTQSPHCSSRNFMAR